MAEKASLNRSQWRPLIRRREAEIRPNPKSGANLVLGFHRGSSKPWRWCTGPCNFASFCISVVTLGWSVSRPATNSVNCYRMTTLPPEKDVYRLHKPESKRIWACLLTNERYLRGVLTLHFSLIKVQTKHPFYVMYTDVRILIHTRNTQSPNGLEAFAAGPQYSFWAAHSHVPYSDDESVDFIRRDGI